MNKGRDGGCITVPNMNSDIVTAFFTTRMYDDRRGCLKEALDISETQVFLPIQNHTDKVHVLASGREPVVADAVVTEERRVLIGVNVADCVPVLLYDGRAQVAGAVHAGWRGTAKRILMNTIETMKRTFSAQTADIMVAVGPCIGGCCYEVGSDVRDSVREATGEGRYCEERGGRHYVDLSSANMQQAVASGIPEENIWLSGLCTCCRPDKFYSYRHAGGTMGRQGGFIIMW